MKNILVAWMLLITAAVSAQSNDADKIVGTYFTDGNEGKVTVALKNNKYFGTLVWLSVSDAVDRENPDQNRRKDKLVGKVVLKDLEYNGKDTWENGTVYDPKSGKTYKCKVTIDKDGNLKVRGFVGVSFAGKTTVWTKVKQKN